MSPEERLWGCEIDNGRKRGVLLERAPFCLAVGKIFVDIGQEDVFSNREGGFVRVKRRRGSILVMSLIVMLVLMIFGLAIFAFAYTNYRTAEQHRGMLMARTAADSLLYSVGAVISDDFARGTPQFPVPLNTPVFAIFRDNPISADVRVFTTNGLYFVLECSAWYEDWQSGKKKLGILKKNLASGVSSEWIWE